MKKLLLLIACMWFINALAQDSTKCNIGKVYGNIILGYGGYFDVNHNFIEYGVGVSYTHKRLGYGVSFSNWDGVDYVSPSVSFNF